MSFESPDVEGRPEPFPRLYHVIHTLTAGNDEVGLQGSQEDSQIRRRDVTRRKEGARRDRKDKGYVMFEQEDSDDELVKGNEDKSPRKAKKHTKPTFKFTKKEKPNKAKEKEKEKDKDEKKEKKEKDKAEKEKEKQEKDKEKKEKVEKEQKKIEEEIKPKWRKKILAPTKQNEQGLTVSVAEDSDAKPIFGVSLALAVERSPCHDGIPLPVVVRQCIDYIEEFGLSCEGIYRMSGVKSKVQSLKDAYNRGLLDIYLQEHEPNVVASLLKQFLRQLPEPLLTAKLMPKFEQASANKNIKQKVEQFQLLLAELPPYNRLLLSWVIVHMTHVIAKEKENKMSLQNVSIVLSPTLQISHRVLNVLFTYSKLLFKDVIIKRYVPPLKPATSRWTLELPESPLAIEEELKKQESLLSHLHEELIKVKDMEKEEQLWEVQRVVTQLKRRLKHAKQMQETAMMSDMKQEEITKDKLEKVASFIPSGKTDENESQDTAEISSEEMSHRVEASGKKVELHVEVVRSDVSIVQKPCTENQQEKNVDKESELEDEVQVDNVTLKVEEIKVTDQNLSTQEETKKQKQIEEIKVTDQNLSTQEETKKQKQIEEIKVTDQKLSTQEETKKQKQVEEIKVTDQNLGTQVEAKEQTKSDEVKTIDEELKNGDIDQNMEAAVVSMTVKNVENDSKDKLTERTVADEMEENAAGDVGLPDAHRIEDGKSMTAHKQQHMGEEEIREPVSDEVLESANHDRRHSTETDDSSDAYTDVLMEEDEEEEEEYPPEMMADAGKGESLNVNYVQLNEGSPMDLEEKRKRLLHYNSEEDFECKRQDTLNTEDSTQMVEEEDQDAFSDTTTSSEPSEFEDNEEYQKLEKEHTYLMLEEEELLAIGNELHQKIAAERNEIDRLQQDIAELKQMRQDVFETSASSSSSSSSLSLSDSDEELDDDELRELLKQLIKENEELELESAGLCDKVHQERQICIAVKVQNRMIQQRHLESSGYGFDLLADQESLL